MVGLWVGDCEVGGCGVVGLGVAGCGTVVWWVVWL